MTRRTLLQSAPLAAMFSGAPAIPENASAEEPEPKHREWKPRLGVLGPFTRSNVEFARAQGFRNMILNGGLATPKGAATVSESDIENAKSLLHENGIGVSAFQASENHIEPDPAKRAVINNRFVHLIEVAGKLGVPYIGTTSGKNAALSFPAQIDEIVRVYNDKYFRACETHHVRILWEPWPDGPNLATSPVGFSALFRAFDNSPHVGLQYDPSHLVRQFMDPIQTARDFVDKIYDVHLKDTEILEPVLRAGGINPVNGASWWRYRIPGMGSMNWREFFNVLQNAGYTGAMSIEQEDSLYGADDPGPDFSPDFQMGFVMAKRYLSRYVP